MKKLSKIVLALVAAVTLFGCKGQTNDSISKTDIETTNLERKQELAQQALMGDYKVSEEAAAESLLSFLVGKDSENERAASTSNYKLEKIDTATVTCPENTKNTNRNSSVEEYDDVDFYLYQIGNSSNENIGYAVLSNDRRIGEVISVLDDSEFSEDISKNPFMQIFCAGLENYVDDTAEIWNSLTDDDLNTAAERASKTPEDTVKEGGWTYSGWSRNPANGNTKYILKTKWDQNDSPYNDCIVDVISGDAYYAGCGAVAVAQIMAFHEWPKNCTSANYSRIKNGWYRASNWNGVYNWKLLKSVESPSSYFSNPSDLQIQIGALLFDVAEGCKSSYDEDGTSTTSANRLSFLNSIGYTYDSETDYSYEAIKTSINNGCPVMLRGYSEKNTKTETVDVPHRFLWWTWTTQETHTTTNYENGHCFIVDGYFNMSCTATKGTNSVNISKDFVHCNPGWGGLNNGYYLSGVFDMRDNHFIADENEILDDMQNSRSSKTSSEDLGDNNYGFNIHQVTNIRRK